MIHISRRDQGKCSRIPTAWARIVRIRTRSVNPEKPLPTNSDADGSAVEVSLAGRREGQEMEIEERQTQPAPLFRSDDYFLIDFLKLRFTASSALPARSSAALDWAAAAFA